MRLEMTREDAEAVIKAYDDAYGECGVTVDDRGNVTYTCPVPSVANEAHPRVYYGPPREESRLEDGTLPGKKRWEKEKALYFHVGDLLCYRQALRTARKRPIIVKEIPQKTGIMGGQKKRPELPSLVQNFF